MRRRLPAIVLLLCALGLSALNAQSTLCAPRRTVPAITGYADQRNFELMVEGGFTSEQAVQIMSANGAKVLGGADRFGTITPGLNADLVVLRGNLTSDPSAIKNVV